MIRLLIVNALKSSKFDGSLLINFGIFCQFDTNYGDNQQRNKTTSRFSFDEMASGEIHTHTHLLTHEYSAERKKCERIIAFGAGSMFNNFT